MIIELVSEYNEKGILMQFPLYFGAYTRGQTEEIAFNKVKQELHEYKKWAGISMLYTDFHIAKRVKAKDDLQINDADSEILLEYDKKRLCESEFDKWCEVALYSADCVLKLYDGIPDKNRIQLEKQRPSFYGATPATANEMLLHIDGVSGFYTSRIGINESFTTGELIENRKKCINSLRNHYKSKPFSIFEVDSEYWTETKVLRRFIWHDRIHAKALYRHGLKMGIKESEMENPFCFNSLL